MNSVAQQLRSIVAVGFWQEFPPVWPLPLPPPLPHNSGKPTLVLDIDETLLHTYAMWEATKTTQAFAVLLRPHLREFLQEMKELYEIVFWTAGTASYCSAMVDAIEVQVLKLPRSFYNVQEVQNDVAGISSTQHVNFFALSRTQTLEEKGYMKYLSMIGRPLHRVVMVDDNVRSFPLQPRNGIKISPFSPNDTVFLNYKKALDFIEKDAEAGGKKDATIQKYIERGIAEEKLLNQDRALLDLLPVLRAAAKAEDLPRELDYWRSDDYVRCDDFRETLNPLSVTRKNVLGSVLLSRREAPIPPQKTHVFNHGFVEEANAAVQQYYMKNAYSRL